MSPRTWKVLTCRPYIDKQHTAHCTVYSLMMVVRLICSHLHIISRWGVGSRHFSACCDCHIQNSPCQMYAHLNHLLCMSLFLLFCSEPTHPKTVDGNVCSSRCNGICSQQHHNNNNQHSRKKKWKKTLVQSHTYMIGIWNKSMIIIRVDLLSANM